MNRYEGMPELLEQFMLETGKAEQWVTVKELRDRFGLTRYQCNTISGFLRRLQYRSFGKCPCVVLRIERTGSTGPAEPPKARYLVRIRHPGISDVSIVPEPEIRSVARSYDM